MSTINNKNYSSPRNINLKDGCLRFAVTQSGSPFNSSSNGLYINDSNQLVFSSQGSDTTVGSAGGGSASTWDTLYDNDKILALDDGVLTFTVSTAANGLHINKTNAGAGIPLVIGNSGSGCDVSAPAWSFISTGSVGILELASGGTINATDGALTIGSAATDTTFAGGTIVTVDEIIAGTATTTVFTITAGDAVISDGSLSITDADEAATVTIINNTAAAVNVVDINADAIAAGGALLHLDSLAAEMSTGLFLECYDGAASAFSIGLYGATVIAGVAANNVFTITAGDVVLSDTSITLTDADDATSLSVTNNANVGTNSALIAIADSGTYVGNTTKSVVTITPSGLTTGTAVYIPVAALTTGTGIQIVGNALTAGQLVEITSSATAITTTGRLFSSVHSGATGTTATLNEFSSTATDETTVVKITASAAIATGKVLHISASAMTGGTALYINATEATITGKYIECYDGAANDFSVAKYGATVIAGNATGTDALTLTAGDITLTSGDLTLTDGDITLTANASKIMGTGTGANGIILKNLKNAAASNLTGTQKDIEIDIGGVAYHFTVYPTKA